METKRRDERENKEARKEEERKRKGNEELEKALVKIVEINERKGGK